MTQREVTSSCPGCCTVNPMCKCRPHPRLCTTLTVVLFIGSGAEFVPRRKLCCLCANHTLPREL